jgi:hypothetical protein
MKLRALVLLLFAASSLPALSQNRGLLGQRFIYLAGGVVYHGDDDVKEIDDTSDLYGAGIQIPIHKRVDLGVGYTRQELAGEVDNVEVESVADIISGRLVYHWRPGQPRDYFAKIAGGLADVETEASVATFQRTVDDDLDYVNASVGAKLPLGLPAAVLPEVGVEDLGDEEALAVKLTTILWLTRGAGIEVVVSRDFDEGDVMLVGSLDVAF